MFKSTVATLVSVALLFVLADVSFAQRGRGGGSSGGGSGSFHGGAVTHGGSAGGGMRGGGRGSWSGGSGRSGGGRGSWHGGSGRGYGYGGGYRHGGGSWHGGGHHHDGWSGSVVFGVGPGWWDPYPYWSYPPVYYGYAAPPYYGYGGAPYYGYAPPAEVEPPAYVQRDDDRAQDYWYYCPSSKGYYPRVEKCREEWVRVLPRSSDDD